MNSSENILRKKITAPHVVTAMIIASLLCGVVQAQEQQQEQQPAPKPNEQSVPKIEIGVQYSQIIFSNSAPFFSDSSPFFSTTADRVPAVGGRVTYNLTDHLSVEAEANIFPFKPIGFDDKEFYVAGGRPFQAQFGVKAGKRFRRFGLFAKARPGLVTFSETLNVKPGPSFIGIGGREFFTVDFFPERKTHFSLDVGGVVEVYASPRVFARFDAGDTIIRYGSHPEASDFNSPNRIFEAPTRTQHNLQFSAGVGFRLGARGDDEDDTAAAAAAAVPRPSGRSAATRFEAGAHFTSLSFSQIRQLFSLPIILGDPAVKTELGFGGRFTYNLTEYLAVEAETNLLPRKIFLAAGASGRVTQGQFGVKAGKRFRSFGLFGKARPGFVAFGSSSTQVGLDPFFFAGRLVLRGAFEIRRRTFFSADVGGVFELYPSRRWLVRFDAGDTIIRYGERSINSEFLNPAVLVAPPETRHNFQFSTGVGFRF